MAGNDALKMATELLEQGVKDIFTSGRMEDYLKVMSRFHNYSARNCVLIMMQCPEATHVASYRKWQKEFNRQVRKGEKSIRILAPIQRKGKKTVVDEQGNEVEKEFKWNSYKAVPVFDISQTDGEELPSLANDLMGRIADFDNLCKKVQEVATVPVVFDAKISDPDCHGYFSEPEGRICIRGGMSEAQTFKTLVHETAHSILHRKDGEQSKASRNQREVQAEGVAYVVCNALGIDSGDYSFGYVAGWGGDSKALMAELDVICKTANEILNKVA